MLTMMNDGETLVLFSNSKVSENLQVDMDNCPPRIAVQSIKDELGRWDDPIQEKPELEFAYVSSEEVKESDPFAEKDEINPIEVPQYFLNRWTSEQKARKVFKVEVKHESAENHYVTLEHDESGASSVSEPELYDLEADAVSQDRNSPGSGVTFPSPTPAPLITAAAEVEDEELVDFASLPGYLTGFSLSPETDPPYVEEPMARRAKNGPPKKRRKRRGIIGGYLPGTLRQRYRKSVQAKIQLASMAVSTYSVHEATPHRDLTSCRSLSAKQGGGVEPSIAATATKKKCRHDYVSPEGREGVTLRKSSRLASNKMQKKVEQSLIVIKKTSKTWVPPNEHGGAILPKSSQVEQSLIVIKKASKTWVPPNECEGAILPKSSRLASQVEQSETAAQHTHSTVQATHEATVTAVQEDETLACTSSTIAPFRTNLQHQENSKASSVFQQTGENYRQSSKSSLPLDSETLQSSNRGFRKKRPRTALRRLGPKAYKAYRLARLGAKIQAAATSMDVCRDFSN